MKHIRIIIADEHRAVREGVRMLLHSQADFRVVGEAARFDEVLDLIREFSPSIVLSETRLQAGSGADLARKLKASGDVARLLAFTAEESTESLQAMLGAGACGYVLKRSSGGELFRAIRNVAAGKVYCDPILAGSLLAGQSSPRGRGKDRAEMALSDQETRVLRLVAWGYTNKEIAGRLRISVKTVETYRSRLQGKLKLKSRPALVLFALKQGWLQIG
ncbi:MAG: response regulator transcription factor [Verrucomicrobiales bacterium]